MACPLDQNWPHRMAPIRYLKFIGPSIAARFAAAPYNITNLQEMVDYVNGHTRAQNEAAWKVIFANNQSGNCVDYTSAHPDRHYSANGPRGAFWNNPPNAPPTGIPLNQRAELVDGDYQYCVRAYNKCGWASTVNYLQNQPAGHVNVGRVPRNQARNRFCRDRDWCRVGPAVAPVVAPVAAPGRARRAPERYRPS